MSLPSRPEFIFLQQEDVIAAGVTDMPMALERVEHTFEMFGRDELRQPVKPLIKLPVNENDDSYSYLMVAMPVYMGGDINRAGIKWAAESLDNAKRGDLPYGIDVIILHDIERAIPLAIMDGSVITAMRTGAAAGVAAKYLANRDSEVVGLVGAGVVGRTSLEAIGLSVPSVRKFRVFDLNRDKSVSLKADFGERWTIEVVDSVQAAVEAADIISTATTAHAPFIKAEWIKPGCFYAHVGYNEAEPQAILDANVLVVDEIEMIKRYDSIAHDLLVRGDLSEDAFVHLSDVVLRRNPGRKNPLDKVIFLSHGMGSLDIAIADRVYQNAKSLGLGQHLTLWDHTGLSLG